MSQLVTGYDEGDGGSFHMNSMYLSVLWAMPFSRKPSTGQQPEKSLSKRMSLYKRGKQTILRRLGKFVENGVEGLVKSYKEGDLFRLAILSLKRTFCMAASSPET
jgi:hypothetical protein